MGVEEQEWHRIEGLDWGIKIWGFDPVFGSGFVTFRWEAMTSDRALDEGWGYCDTYGNQGTLEGCLDKLLELSEQIRPEGN